MSKEEKLMLRDKYVKAYNLMNILDGLLGNVDINMDLEKMNNWLNSIINFYSLYGVKLTEKDFLYNNKINFVRKYVYLLFKNRHNLDNNVFNELIFNMPNLEMFDSSNNPILSYFIQIVKSINERNSSVFDNFLDKINDYLSELGINKVFLNNISDIKHEIEKKIILIDEEIASQEKKEQDELLDHRFAIDLCALLSDCDYYYMSSQEQNYLLENLDRICLMIVKLRIFRDVSEQYKKYSELKDYKRLLDIVKGKKITINMLEQKFNTLNEKPYGMIRNLFLNRLFDKISILNCEIEQLLKDYFSNFYMMFDMEKLSNVYNVSGLDDTTKLFGEFEFESLPPNIDKIIFYLFDEFGIIIPNIDSKSFDRVSIMALQYLNRNNDKFNNKYNTYKRKKNKNNV